MIFGFILSFDDVNVSLFLVDTRTATLPISVMSYLQYSFDPSVAAISSMLIALIFGGTRSIAGNVIGTCFIIVLPDVFNSIAEYQLMIFGGLLLFTLYFMPDGIAGLLRLAAARLTHRRSRPRGAAAADRELRRLSAGIDPIVAGSEIVLALQTIIARKLDPMAQGVVSVTEFITDGLAHRSIVLP